MKTFEKISVLVLAGLIVLVQSAARAAEQKQDFLIRNALAEPVNLEIGDNQFSHVWAKSIINARWETSLSHVKVEDRNVLTVRILNQSTSQEGQEITRCQSTMTDTTQAPRMAVIIYNQEGIRHCSVVDLNAFQPIASAPSGQDVAAKNMLVKG